MNQLPDNVLLKIFSFINWRKRISLESVCTRWEIMLRSSKSLQYIGSIHLDSLIKTGDLHLVPDVIQSLVTKVIQPIMSTITSVEPISLKRLSIKFDKAHYTGQSYVDIISACNPMICLCIHLEMLEISVRSSPRPNLPEVTVDLNGLVHLKELIGQKVRFVNCRSSVLRVLRYSYVHDNSNSHHFRQMISSASESMEVLELKYITIDSRFNQPNIEFVFPKLKKLSLYSIDLKGVTINLIDSGYFEHLFLYDVWGCDIINFNLSLFHLTFLCVHNYTGNVLEQFLSYCKASGSDRLCMLETLSVSFESGQALFDFFGCFSSLYTYSFRVFEVDSSGFSVLLDPSSVVTIARSSPYLESLGLYCIIDLECLMELITLKANVDCFNILRVKVITNPANIDFVSRLGNSLLSVNPSIVKREKGIDIEYCRWDDQNCVDELVTFNEKFNIIRQVIARSPLPVFTIEDQLSG